MAHALSKALGSGVKAPGLQDVSTVLGAREEALHPNSTGVKGMGWYLPEQSLLANRCNMAALAFTQERL
jgi:hypothetical protein